jgi:hypothetical protein
VDRVSGVHDCQAYLEGFGMTTLTLDTLLEAKAKMEDLLRQSPSPTPTLGYGEVNPWRTGFRIIVSSSATVDSDVRLFPESRHRSARIHKKLVKRHGGVFRQKPAIFHADNGDLIAHPALYEALKQNVERQINARFDNMIHQPQSPNEA